MILANVVLVLYLSYNLEVAHIPHSMATGVDDVSRRYWPVHPRSFPTGRLDPEIDQ